MSSIELKRLARRIAKIEREQANQGKPQLAYSSIENGNVKSYEGGDLKMIVGLQDDGGQTTQVFNGPTPPTPVGFTVDVDHGKFIVHWSGDFDGDKLAPSDWSRAEVHASQDPFFVPDRTTARGSIVSAAGGEVTIGVLKGPWTIKMLAWSQAGKMSAPSAPVDVEVPGYGEIVLEEIDAAQTRIDNARAILVDGQETLGTKLDEADTALASLRESLDNLDETTLPALRQDLDAAEGRLSTAEGQITDAFGQLDAVPGQISNARQEAINAALAEIDSVEGGLTSTIDKKITWSLDAPPVVFDGPKDATWFRVSSFGSGGQVVSQWRWNGTVWVSTVMSESVLAKINIGTGTFGNMSGSRIDVGSVTSDKVLVGAGRNIIPWSQVLAGQTVSPHVNSDYYGTGTVAVSGADATRGVPAHLKHTRTTSDPGVDRYVLQFYPAPFTGGASNRFAVQKGTWTLRVSAYTDVANLDAKVALIWYAADLSYGAASTSAPVRLGTQPKKLSVSIDLPDAAAYIMPYIRTNQPGETHWVNPELAQAVGGTLIEPGGIKTPHLAADVLEVGNLKAGAGAIAEVVSQKIAAAVGQFLELDVGQLTVTGASKLASVVAEQIAADVGEYVELSVGQLVAGEGVMDEAVIQKLFTDVVVAGISQAQEFIGSNAILDDSVTAPKIVASEELWAKLAQFVNVRAEMIDSDAFNGRVFTGNTYLTTDGNGRFSDAGLFISQPDGTSMVRFPTDGSPLSLTASDTQIDRASVRDLDVVDAAVRSGGTFNLASGVTPPASPPELVAGWQRFTALEKPTNYPPHAWEHLAYWEGGDAWVRTVNVFGATSSDPDMLELYDSTTGAFQWSFKLDLNPTNGVTVMGDTVYVMGDVYTPSKSTWIYGYDLNTGYRVASHEYTRAIETKNALGNDGTNLIIGSVFKRELWVHRRNPTTGEQVGSDMLSGSNTWPGPEESRLFGVTINGTEVTVVHATGARVYTISGSTLNRKTSAEWVNPDKSASGYVWLDSAPYIIDEQGAIFKGSGFGADSTLDACYTWFDGTHETTPSQIATVAVPARAVTTVSMSQRAGLQKRLYTRSSAAGGWRRYTLPEAVTAYEEASTLSGLYVPPTVNTFPNADPATLKSTNDKFEVKGDGSGHWGPLVFNADGTMTSTAVPAWIPVTTFASGYGPQTWGFAPAYRVWPDEKVEWRGVIQGNFDTTGNWKVPFTMPNDARPAQAVNTTAAARGTGSLLKRVEFSPTANASEFRVYSGDADSTWVSLEGIYYYKS